MIPFGAIAAGILAARMLAGRQGGVVARPVRTPRARWMILLWAIVLPIWGILGLALVLGGFTAAAGGVVGSALVLLLPLFFPWAFARHVFVPLGMPRAAYFTVAALPDWAWMRDPRGGAVLAGAWALLRQRRPDATRADWLERKLSSATDHKALAGAGVAASGLLAAARGDLEGARAILTSVRLVDPKATPKAARRIALDWLLADAASRGHWKAVADLRLETDASRSVRLCADIARRLLGDALAPSKARIWLGWALAPHRRATLPLVRRAVATEARVPETSAPEAEPAPEHEHLWDRALAAHARLLRHDATEVGARVGGEALARLGIAWDGALADRGEQSVLAERAFVLGLSVAAAHGGAAIARITRAVEDDIAALARAAGVRLEALRSAGGTAARAAERLRDELLAEVELASGALRRRTDEKRALPATAEWRESIAIRAQYEHAVGLGGPELQRLLFSRVKNDVWSHAYWLSSERSERTVANAAYVWLLAEARAVGDTRAIDPLTGNVAATAAPDPMR